MKLDSSYNASPSPLAADISSLKEPLLKKETPDNAQNTARGTLEGIAIDHVSSHDSSASRGYHPPKLNSSDSATTDHSIVVAPALEKSSFGKSFSAAFSKTASAAKNLNSALASSSAPRKLSPEAEEKNEEQKIFSHAIETTCFLLEHSSPEDKVRDSVGKILATIDRFTFYREDRLDDWNNEIDKVIKQAQQEMVTHAEKQATELLRADPTSQAQEKKAMEILTNGFKQATPFAQRAQLDAKEITKRAEEFLIEVRAKL